MKRYKVFWTNEAVLDLEEILEYISADKRSAAIAVYRAIKKRATFLARSPQKYRIVSELNELGINQYREIIYSSYRVVYKIGDSDVFVIAVIDSRRDFESFIFHRLMRNI